MRATKKIRLTDEQRDMVEKNLGLAHAFAARDLGKDHYDDVLSHTYLGLTRAAATYDPATGIQFSTYASWWMRNQVILYLRSLGLIHIPAYLNTRKVRDYREYHQCRNEYERCAYRVMHAETTTDMGVLANHAGPTDRGEESDDGKHVPEWIVALLANLPAEDAELIAKRFIEGETLESVGEMFGITGEAIRKRQEKILERARKILAGKSNKKGVA